MMEPSISMRRHERRIQILLFVLLFIAYIFVLPRWAEWSQNSRLNLTFAIVDEGQLSIDTYYKNSGDYALFNGRHYTDKAPGPSFFAVPVYAAVRPILRMPIVQSAIERVSHSPAFANTLNQDGSGLMADKIYYFIVLYISTVIVVCLPAAVLGVLVYRFVRHMGVRMGWSLAVALIYGLATPAFTYSAAFFSHQIVAFLLFGAFTIGHCVSRGGRSNAWLLLAGFMLGLSLISEYPTALIVFGVGLYILRHLWQTAQLKWALPFMAAAAPPLLLLAAYNFSIFGTPLPVGYAYSENYTAIHSQGLISLTYPHIDALWGITFGSFRGLFYVSPVLLLAVAGFWGWWRMGKLRAEWAVCVWATVSFFLFNGSSVMWEGGFSVGPRYLVPMLPFFASALGAFALCWGQRLWARVVTTVLVAWSFVAVWSLTLAGQNYPDWTPEPLVNYALPRLLQGDLARNLGMIVNLKGWLSFAPLAVVLGVLLFVLAHLARQVDFIEKQPANDEQPNWINTHEPAEA